MTLKQRLAKAYKGLPQKAQDALAIMAGVAVAAIACVVLYYAIWIYYIIAHPEYNI